MMRIVSGVFVGHRTADLVLEHLVQEFDVPRERVQVHTVDAASGDESRSTQDDDQEMSLPELGLPDEAVRGYIEAMRRGGVLLAAWVDDGHVDRVLGTYREYAAADPATCEARVPGATDDPEQGVRIRAYHLWEQAGRPAGRDLEFWHRARAEGEAAGRAPQEFAGETGAAPLPERGASSGG